MYASSLRFFPALLILCSQSICAQETSQPAKRSIIERDLFSFQWIGDPKLSPDGSHAVFVKVIVDAKHEGYETSLWLADLRSPGIAPRQLTNGPHDSAPAWSPDGSMLAFNRALEKDGKLLPPQIWLMSFGGGEPRTVTSLPRAARNPQFSPDGRRILFSSDTAPEDLTKADRVKAGAKPEEHESDVHVITHAVYRENGEGYIDYKHPSHFWLVDVSKEANGAPPKPRQVTSGRFTQNDGVWAPDGNGIYFLTDPVDEPYYEEPKNELDRLDIASGAVTVVRKFDFQAAALSISHDGKRVAFHASVNTPARSYSQPDLWVMELAPSASPRNLTEHYDFDMGDGIGGDNRAPRAAGSSAPLWRPDDQNILDISGQEGSANVVSVNTQTGAVTPFTKGRQAVQLLTQSSDGAHLAALISTPVEVGDLFTIAADGAQQRATNINEELFSQLNLTLPEEIWFKSFDGRRIQAWVQKPPDFDPARKYPLILNIHGGPHAAYGWVFDHEFQWMAAQGYVVVYPNPRGSTTYGQVFGNIIQHHYPGDDYRDLMLAVDEVVKRGYVDPQRLGVTGGSGGGVLTDWTVTHTNRFKAAVSQRDISDWTSWWYTDDFVLFQPTWFKGTPFNEPEDFRSRSAITFVKRIQTPMMFILGDADLRTPPESGGEQLFRALKFMHEPTAMVRFPGESHELSRSGQPWHRVERLEHIVGWFDKYLKGEAKPEYDIAPGITPQPAAHPYEEEKSTVH